MRRLAGALLVALVLPLGALTMRPPAAARQAEGSLTIYNAICPPGYDGDRHFEDCFDNPVAGAEFAISETKADFFASARTDASGFATLPLPPDILAGDVAVARSPAVEVFDGQPPFVVLCTKGNGAEAVDVRYSQVQLDPGGDAFLAEVAAAPGDQIRCDWYDIPPGDDGDDTAPPSSATGVDSDGLGSTRAAWEARHGPGELTDAYAPPYRAVYQYENGTYFVQFSGQEGPEDVLTYIEVAWPGDGVELIEAEARTRSLLPADVALTEAFYAPRTPGGPTALRVFLATSPSLAARLGASAENLAIPNVQVIFHERLRDPQTVRPGESPDAITRVSLTAQLPPG